MRGAMSLRLSVLLVSLGLSGGCAQMQDYGGMTAGGVGSVMMAQELNLIEPQYLAGGLIAYAIYDPLAPTWRIQVTQLDDHRYRLDLRMKSLITGGEGEARQVFRRNAQAIVDENDFSGYDILRYEEGVESTRPFARRIASGEIRVARSQTWPGM